MTQTSDFAPIADQFVAAAQSSAFGYFDFLPASAYALDQLFDATWPGGGDLNAALTDRQRQSATTHGIFFGELMRRNFNGRWALDPKQPDNLWFATLSFPTGLTCFPLARARKRLVVGAQEGFNVFYEHVRAGLKVATLPGEADSWVRHADFFLRTHRAHAALFCLGRAESLEPVRTAALAHRREIARAALARERPVGQPEPVAQPSEVKPENDPAVLLAHARTLAGTGQLVPANATYRQVLAADAKNVDAMRELSVGLSLENKMAESLEWADRAIALAPDDPRTFDTKAVTLGRMAKFEDAIRLIDEALRRHPKHGSLLLRRGNFTARLGRFEESLGFLRRALTIEADNADARLTLADVLARLGQKDAALEEIARCLQLTSLPPRTRDVAVRLRWQLQHPGQTLEPKQADAWLERAFEKMSAGKPTEALTCFDEATAANPLSFELWHNRAICAMGLNKFDEALRCFDRALELNPGFAQSRAGRAAALSALGNVRKNPP